MQAQRKYAQQFYECVKQRTCVLNRPFARRVLSHMALLTTQTPTTLVQWLQRCSDTDLHQALLTHWKDLDIQGVSGMRRCFWLHVLDHPRECTARCDSQPQIV